MEMTGPCEIHGNSIPVLMETDVAGVRRGCKRNVEIKMHFTVMLLLQCLQWQKKNLSAMSS